MLRGGNGEQKTLKPSTNLSRPLVLPVFPNLWHIALIATSSSQNSYYSASSERPVVSIVITHRGKFWNPFGAETSSATYSGHKFKDQNPKFSHALVMCLKDRVFTVSE